MISYRRWVSGVVSRRDREPKVQIPRQRDCLAGAALRGDGLVHPDVNGLRVHTSSAQEHNGYNCQ